MPRDLATAQAELDEAKDALEALQERVRDGDAEVTPEQLATQRELIAFAELRVESAQRTETRLREEERAAVGAAAKEAAEALITGPSLGEIADAARAAADALARLTSLVSLRNQKINEIGTTLVGLGEDLKRGQVIDEKEPWGSKRYGVWGDARDVIVPGVGKASYVDPGDVSVAVVVAGLGIDAAGIAAQDRHMHRFHGLRNDVVRQVVDIHPAIADALRVTPEEYAAANWRGRAMLTEQGRLPLPEAVEG